MPVLIFSAKLLIVSDSAPAPAGQPEGVAMRESAGSSTLPARYVAQLVDYLESIGVDRARMLRAGRIRSVDTPNGQVTLRQMDALLEGAEQASGRQDLGFELGRRLDPTSHDILGFALLTSPTFGHFLRLAVTYQRLMQPFFALRLQRTTGRVELVYRPAVALPSRSMRMLQEAIVLSNHVGFQSALRGKVPAYEARLSIARPAHAERYRGLAPARFHFGDAAPGVRISLDAALLDTPLAMANPRAMQAAEERCKVQLRQTRARRRWSEWCRMMLRESEDSRPTLEQLAGFMNISPRTLARYLEAEGAGFRDLALEVRTERARALLADGDLSVTQIAYRLG
jgi:AraC-like DNA-binding protein